MVGFVSLPPFNTAVIGGFVAFSAVLLRCLPSIAAFEVPSTALLLPSWLIYVSSVLDWFHLGFNIGLSLWFSG